MQHIFTAVPNGSDDQPPPSNASETLAAVHQAQQLDLHLNSMFLGYLSGSRTIIVNAIQLAEDIYGEDSREHKYSRFLLQHLDKLIGAIDHKISVD